MQGNHGWHGLRPSAVAWRSGALPMRGAPEWMVGGPNCFRWVFAMAGQRCDEYSGRKTPNHDLGEDCVKVNVLLATYWYIPHVGGVDTYIGLLKKRFEKLGHHVDILAHHPDMTKIYMVNTGETLEKSKIKDIVYDKVYEYYEKNFPRVDEWIRWREIERYTYELASVAFGLRRYDIIHTQDIVSTRAIHRVKPPNVRHVATIHGLLASEHIIAGDIESKESLKWSFVSAEERYGAVSADETILPTEWLLRELTGNFGVPHRGLHVIPYGMDSARFLRANKEEPRDVTIDPKQKYIVCPARLTPVKGHQYLLEALSRLKDVRHDFVCWIVGDGQSETMLKDMARSLELGRHVVFLGARKDVGALLRNAYATVLPSVQDNLPFVIMESQVTGTPVVASAVGGIPEMIQHGRTGLLFENKNSVQLFEMLNMLLSDPHLRASLSANGRNWGASQWSVDTLVGKTLRVYDKAMSSPSRQTRR